MRPAQKRLASEVVELIHGGQAVRKAKVMSEMLFPSYQPAIAVRPASGQNGVGSGNVAHELSAEGIVEAFEGDKCLSILPRKEVIGEYLTKVAAMAGAVKSRSEAETLVRQGGLYVSVGAGVTNGLRKAGGGEKVQEDLLVGGHVLLLRVGKGGMSIINVI